MIFIRFNIRWVVFGILFFAPLMTMGEGMNASKPQAFHYSYRGITIKELIAAYSDSYAKAGFRLGKIEGRKYIYDVYFEFKKKIGNHTYEARLLYRFDTIPGPVCSPCDVTPVLMSMSEKDKSMGEFPVFWAEARDAEIHANEELAIKLKGNAI